MKRKYKGLSRKAKWLVEDERLIPDEYFILVQEMKLDKKRVLQELKKGKTIPGVSLVTKPFVSGLRRRKDEHF